MDGLTDTDDRPESLKGMALVDIILLANDGGMSKTEQEWYNKRSWKILDRKKDAIPPDRNAWMAK